MFSISVDKANELVEVRLSGMMSVDEVAEYITELKRRIVAHGLCTYAMVTDVTGCPIQSQDMINAMAQHMATMPKARSLAVVTGSSLAKMQVRRLFTQSYARITTTAKEGRDWVLHGIEPGTS